MKRIIFAWVVTIIYFLLLPGVNELKFDTICCFTVGWAFGYVMYPDVHTVAMKLKKFIRKYKERECA